MIKFLLTLVFLLSVLGCGNTKESLEEDYKKASHALEKARKVLYATKEWQEYGKANEDSEKASWLVLEATIEWQEYDKAGQAYTKARKALEKAKDGHND